MLSTNLQELDDFTYPLMQLPVNKLPVETIRFNNIQSFDNILKKLKEEFPG